MNDDEQEPRSAGPLRVVILGAGMVARQHAQAYQEIGAQVVGVADLDDAAACALAAPWGALVATDYHALLRDASADAVSVCLPNYLHLPATQEALTRGLHVLCEKPLALTSAQAREMVAQAESRGRVLLTGYHHRYQEAIAQVKALIVGGDLGTLCSFRCRFAWQTRRPQAWNTNPGQSGGGVLIDSGGHAIDLYRHLVGEVARVSAVLTTLQPGSAVEDNAIVLLEGQACVPGVIEVSWTTPHTIMELVVEGTRATARADFTGLPLAWAALRRDDEWTPLHDQCPNPYAREVAHFRDCIEGRATPLVDGHEGVRTLLVVEAAYRAAQERRAIAVEVMRPGEPLKGASCDGSSRQ